MNRQTRELLDELDKTAVFLLWGAIITFIVFPLVLMLVFGIVFDEVAF